MSLKNWSLLIFISIFWGGSFFFVEIALHDFSPPMIVFLRVAIAAVALVLVMRLSGYYFPKSPAVWASYAVTGLLSNVIPFNLIVWGQTHIDSGIASILNATTPIFAVLVAHWFTADEKLTVHKLAGVLIGFGGVIVMMQGSITAGVGWQNIGQIAVIIASLSYALAAVWGKRLNQFPAIVNATCMLLCSALLMIPLILLEARQVTQLSPSWESVAAIMCIALLSSALNYVIYFKLLKSSGAINLTLVTFLVPVSALFLGMTFLHEQLDITAFVGMLIIFFGLLLIDGRLFITETRRRKI